MGDLWEMGRKIANKPGSSESWITLRATGTCTESAAHIPAEHGRKNTQHGRKDVRPDRKVPNSTPKNSWLKAAQNKPHLDLYEDS